MRLYIMYIIYTYRMYIYIYTYVILWYNYNSYNIYTITYSDVVSYMIRKIHLTKASVDTAGPVGSWRVGGLSSAACGSGEAASMWALVRTGWCGNENEKRWKNGIPYICLVATQIILIFTPIWGNDPFWLIFFKGVENHQLDMVL